MKIPKANVLSAVSICALLTLSLSPASSGGRPAESGQWGAPVGGLQMSVSAVDSINAGVPAFQVALRNVGEQDVTLNLGVMLANGKVQLPERISLNLTDAAGRTRALRFFDKKYPAVAGRMDDYVIPLRAGSTYTLALNLDQFWSPATKEFQLELLPGEYRIFAEFEGGGAKVDNLDMPGMRLMNFWGGRLRSNALVVKR